MRLSSLCCSVIFVLCMLASVSPHRRRTIPSRPPLWRGPRYHTPNLMPIMPLPMSDPMSSFLGLLRHRQPVQWWEGPNVCKTETEEDAEDNQSFDSLHNFQVTFETCSQSETLYKCEVKKQNSTGFNKKFTTSYHCCHGYTRVRGDHGCPTRHQMTDLMQTVSMRDDLSDFNTAINILQLRQLLEEANFTVFAPVNGAFDFNQNIMPGSVDFVLGDTPRVLEASRYSAEAAVESLENLVMGHLVGGIMTSESIADEQVLVTSNNQDSTIRVNYFRRHGQPQLMMANCVPVTSRDQLATNGVLHVVSRGLKPVTESLLDVVRRREDLSTLKTVLAAADYVSEMDADGSFTLLAPTNSAFEQMNPRLRERLLKGDRKCIQKVLASHLLPHVICTGALSAESTSPNLLRKPVNLTVTSQGKMFADGAQILQYDVMATNGVIHVIDEVLVPQEAMDYLDVLEERGYTKFTNLIDFAELTKSLEAKDNVTVFVPTNQAIQSLPKPIQERLKDKAFLQEVVNFHVTLGMHDNHYLRHNTKLPTLSGSNLRVNSYWRTQFGFVRRPGNHVITAQCAKIIEEDIQACNGRIYVINQVMMPPQGNVLDVLAMDRRFSQLVGLIKKAALADLLQEDGPYTIFAPSNKALASLDAKLLQSLTEDEHTLRNFIKRHIFQNVMCCAGIHARNFLYKPQVWMMNGERYTIESKGGMRLDGEEELTVGGTKIVSCDRTGTNGVVLEIDSVLLPRRPRRRFLEDFFFHGWD